MRTFILLTLFITASLAHAEIVRQVSNDGNSRIVSVRDAALVHTIQVMAKGADAKAQTNAVLDQLDSLLRTADSSLDACVKLNIYLTQETLYDEVNTVLTERIAAENRPSLTYVTSALPKEGALLAIDAVAAATDGAKASPDATEGSTPRSTATMPVGARVYISGQAEKGDGALEDATRQTMASLGRTLEFLGLTKSDVIQVKGFLTPMKQHADTEKAIAEFFAPLAPPPSILVEWVSSLPIEIEMIVAAPSLSDGPSVEVRTPPGMSTPAVYSRLTITRHPVTLYTDGHYPADPAATPQIQLRSLFSQLKTSIDLGGSDWMHLVKATYYVSDDDLSKEHNIVRPDYFSPRLPPAASKASVVGVGRSGQGITQDFIVVPGE